MSELQPGDWIAGEYRVRRVFGGKGRSGMGVVYLVEGRTSGQPFVLKTFQSHKDSEDLVRRFEKEAEIWVGLGKHPNLVECFWVRRHSKQLFVAAEFIWPDLAKRNTLTHHIASGHIPVANQVRWLSHCCYAMRHAMKHGLRAHRDIKPDNMMIDGTGTLKLTDFGLARIHDHDEHHRGDATRDVLQAADVTGTGAVLGTLPFMAPEQFALSAEADFRSDIYSVGVVAFMMANEGNLPVLPNEQSASLQAWADAHMRQRINVSDSPLEPVIARCLEKDPRRRFQSFDELIDAISSVGRKNQIPTIVEETRNDQAFSTEWTKAMALVGTGKHQAAEALLHKLIDRWPTRSALHTELSGALLGLGRWEDAARAAQQSLQIEENSTAAWNNLGAAQANMGKLKEAKESFEKALLVDPENSGAMTSLASLYIKEREFENARVVAEIAYFWRPEKIMVLQVLIECYMRQRQFDRATEILKKLVSLDPTDTAAWFNLSLCHQANGDAHSRITALKQVVKLRNSDGEAANALLDAQAGIGAIDEAIATAEKLAHIPKWEIAGTAKRAQLYAVRGDITSAYLVLSNALKRNERSAALWFSMSAILRDHPQYEKQAKAAIGNALLCARERPGQLTRENLDILHQWACESR